MACECLKNAKKLLNEKFNDPEGSINASISMNFNTGDSLCRWPSLEYSYHPLKKDGNRSKQVNKTSIVPTFCPLCGEKYVEKENGG